MQLGKAIWKLQLLVAFEACFFIPMLERRHIFVLILSLYVIIIVTYGTLSIDSNGPQNQ